jgi:hypothetical protein
MTLYKTNQQKQKLKKSGNPRIYGQNKLLFWHLALQPLGNFSHVYRSSSKNTRKIKIQPILNKNSSHHITMGAMRGSVHPGPYRVGI